MMLAPSLWICACTRIDVATSLACVAIQAHSPPDTRQRRKMPTKSEWLALVDEWAGDIKRSIAASQAAFQHEKHALQLRLETSPTPFQPSTVLTQLVNGEQRRGLSAKLHKRRVKSAEHLERKLESEVRQHYEGESAQACSKWKQLHAHLMDNHRELTDRIKHHVKLLSESLRLKALPLDPDTVLTKNQADELLDDETEIQRQHLLIESEWIQQERFNIQEAFTNQTTKIQADYQAFLDQLDADFIAEQRKIVAHALPDVSPVAAAKKNVPGSRQKAVANHQLNRQFKSNTKRHLLVQTAPVVELHSGECSTNYLKAQSDSSDMTPIDHKLQELEQRLAASKETAEARLKDGMQWIARQCAHMFTQLDCKEAEAKLVFLLTQQHHDGTLQLLRRVEFVASLLRSSIHEHDGELPRLPLLEVLPSVAVATAAANNSLRLGPLAPPLKAHHLNLRRRSELVGLK